jgi:hypothetical protein
MARRVNISVHVNTREAFADIERLRQQAASPMGAFGAAGTSVGGSGVLPAVLFSSAIGSLGVRDSQQFAANLLMLGRFESDSVARAVSDVKKGGSPGRPVTILKSPATTAWLGSVSATMFGAAPTGSAPPGTTAPPVESPVRRAARLGPHTTTVPVTIRKVDVTIDPPAAKIPKISSGMQKVVIDAESVKKYSKRFNKKGSIAMGAMLAGIGDGVKKTWSAVAGAEGMGKRLMKHSGFIPRWMGMTAGMGAAFAIVGESRATADLRMDFFKDVARSGGDIDPEVLTTRLSAMYGDRLRGIGGDMVSMLGHTAVTFWDIIGGAWTATNLISMKVTGSQSSKDHFAKEQTRIARIGFNLRHRTGLLDAEIEKMREGQRTYDDGLENARSRAMDHARRVADMHASRLQSVGVNVSRAELRSLFDNEESDFRATILQEYERQYHDQMRAAGRYRPSWDDVNPFVGNLSGK